MVQTYSYTCIRCGYDAGLSDGKDCGMTAVVRTSICKSCSSLVDVIIGFFIHFTVTLAYYFIPKRQDILL